MAVNEDRFLRNLLALDGSVDKIGALSTYMQMSDARATCCVWMSAVEAAAPTRALPLLYLANDVMQRTRAKTAAFVAEFAKYLPAALTRAAAAQPTSLDAYLRLTGLWAARSVYSASFMQRCEAAAHEAASGARAAAAAGAAAATGHSGVGRGAVCRSRARERLGLK